MFCNSILWKQNSYCSNFEFVVTTPKCFCIYRLKCSKAISGWMGIPIHGNLCKHLFEEHRSPVLIRDALKSIGVLFSARVSELSRTKRTVKSHGEKIPWLNTAVHFWFCSRPAQMFSLTVYSGLFSTCVRPPTTTRFSNFGTSPDPHTQVFCGGGYIFTGSDYSQGGQEWFIAHHL